MTIYFLINLSVALSWLAFRFWPRRSLSFRWQKFFAQTVLALSLVAPLAAVVTPDSFYPRVGIPPQVMKSVRDADAGSFKRELVISKPAPIPKAPAPIIKRGWKPNLVWIFAFGLLVCCGRLIWQWVSLRASLKNSICLHRIGRVRVAVDDGVAVPFSFTFGWLAHIVLPSRLLGFREDFKIALRHEIEHHRRGDTAWAQILELLLCLFYLNPAMHAWKKMILELQELACDEALIGRMRVPPRDYGRCLLRVAEMALGSRIMRAGTTCMIPESNSTGRSFLRRRFIMMAQHEHPKRRRILSVASGTILGIAVLCSAFAAQAALHSLPLHAPNPGHPVFDPAVQEIAQNALAKSVNELRAGGGFVLVSDPATGRLLAAAGLNKGFESGGLPQDWPLSYGLIPASTLKGVVAAAALQAGVTTPDEQHDCGHGKYRVGNRVYHDSQAYDHLSTTETIVHSSNICSIKIGEELGASGLQETLSTFGFGPGGTAKEFPAARPGFVPQHEGTSDGSYVSLVAEGFSDRSGFYVTPLEMVQAYGAIANGGRLMRPIAANATDSKMIAQVISPEVSAEMRQILRRVVTNGTGESIRDSDYPIAGKTGSAWIDGGPNMGSFIGFAPADNPRVVVYAVIINAKALKTTYGSKTAAPLVKDVADKVLAHMGL